MRQRERFPQRLKAGEFLGGIFCCSYGLQNAEVIAGSGFDFVLFDHEHTPWSLPDFHAQLMAMQVGGTGAVVRMTGVDPAAVKWLLDLGVDGLMIPNVNSLEDAQRAVAACRYPPQGRRGVGGSVRGTRYGRSPLSAVESVSRFSLIAQIESREGLAQLDAIARLEGIDAIFFGPNDLAADMGHFAQPNHPDVVQAILNGFGAVSAAGKAIGVLAAGEALTRYVEAGATLCAAGSDLGLLVKAADGLASTLKTLSETRLSHA